MAYEQRDMSGSLFINDKKEKESQPDRNGTAMIGGKMYRLSGWIKHPKGGGNPFLSLAFTPVEETKQAAKSRSHDTEEVPF